MNNVENEIERLEERLDKLPSYDCPAALRLLEQIAQLQQGLLK